MARSAEFYLQKAEEFDAAGEADKAQAMRDAADSLPKPAFSSLSKLSKKNKTKEGFRL